MDNAIEVTNLRRNYGEFTAVDGVSLEVAHGEVYGLLGTNGAGKTSTLEILEGLAHPTAGKVRVLGLDPLAQRAQVRPHTGIMLQSGGLPQTLTVTETLTMWAGTCSTPLPVDAVLGDVDLQDRRDVKVGSLSGGEQRRLDLACALVGDPSALFLDEPTTGLDPESRRRVWELLQRLKDNGVTIVLTTHYLEEAERLCDRIAIMHRGRIELEGTIAQLANTVAAEIEFTLAADAPPPPELPGTTTRRPSDRETGGTRGTRVTIATTQLQNDTFAILHWAHEHNVTLGQFAARSASLEQVFHRVANTGATNNGKEAA